MTSDDTVRYEENEVPVGDFVETLAVIEEQPLSARASSYIAVQDRLRARLEGADERR